MGEVLKFRRPRRRTRASLPTQSGTIFLFTGVWRGRLDEPETSPQPPRKLRVKRSADKLADAASPQPDSTASNAVPDGDIPKRGGKARMSRRDKISG